MKWIYYSILVAPTLQQRFQKWTSLTSLLVRNTLSCPLRKSMGCVWTPVPDVKDCLRLYVSVNYADDDGDVERRVDNQEEFDNMIGLITHLKFCKTTNRLVDGRTVTPLTTEYFKCLVSPTITMYDECCACLEMTRGKTMCNHTICLHCLSRLALPICPLCRASVRGYDDDE